MFKDVWSPFIQPVPIPTSYLPSHITSRVATSFASSAGWRKSLLNTKVPNVILELKDAAWAIAGTEA